MRATGQLSFDVHQHPDAEARGDGAWLDGSLKIAGDFGVRENLQPGDRVTVSIADADGQVVTSAIAEIGAVSFVPVKVEGRVIGTERVHKAKIVDVAQQD